MRFIIDSNEFIFAFGPARDLIKLQFLDILLDKIHLHSVCIPRTIFEEVRRNLSSKSFHEFNKFICAISMIDEDIVVPFETASKY